MPNVGETTGTAMGNVRLGQGNQVVRATKLPTGQTLATFTRAIGVIGLAVAATILTIPNVAAVQSASSDDVESLCRAALDTKLEYWMDYGPYKPDADEAKRRGLSIETCRAAVLKKRAATNPPAVNGNGQPSPAPLEANKNAMEDDMLLLDVIVGKRSADEIAITHRNKVVAFGGQITGRDTDDDATVVAIENGTAICRFTDTQQRLAVSRIGRGCWKWRGKLSRVSGGHLYFENCEFRACGGK